jgi:hypothetical protein
MRLLERESVDWARLVRRACERYLQLPLRETLRFLRERLDAPVPTDVLDALVPPEPARLFWLEYHAMSAEPRRSTGLHRAAAVVMTKLRRGEAVSGSGLLPIVTPDQAAPSSYVTS